MKTKRNSSIEIFRLVGLSFIIFFHMTGYSVFTKGLGDNAVMGFLNSRAWFAWPISYGIS